MAHYRVHKVNIRKKIEPEELEVYLNGLDGKIISIIPNITPRMHPMGATARYDYLLVVVELP